MAIFRMQQKSSTWNYIHILCDSWIRVLKCGILTTKFLIFFTNKLCCESHYRKSTYFWMEYGYPWEFFHSSVIIFCNNFLFLMDNYYKTICRLFRSEYSSCMTWIDCLRCRICSSSLWLMSVSGRIYYHPPRSCRKVMFSEVSVILLGDGVGTPWYNLPTPRIPYPSGYPNPTDSDWHLLLITRDLFNFVHLSTYHLPLSNI